MIFPSTHKVYETISKSPVEKGRVMTICTQNSGNISGTSTKEFENIQS